MIFELGLFNSSEKNSINFLNFEKYISETFSNCFVKYTPI